MQHTDTIIIGAGPAGASAAIQLRRSRVRFILLEKGMIGGLTRTANLIENFPILEPVPGGVFGTLLSDQLRSFHIPIRRSEVMRVRCEGDKFLVETQDSAFTSRALIVASGTKPRKARIPGISALGEGRVFYESYRVPDDGGPARIIVLGGGDAAFDYALCLARKGHRVAIVMRSGNPACLPLLAERARAINCIEIVSGVRGLELVQGKRQFALRGKSREGAISLRGDYLLPAFGRDPVLEFLPHKLRCPRAESPRNDRCPGLFFAGDVRHGLFRQAAIAAGDGILAAMMVKHFLDGAGE